MVVDGSPAWHVYHSLPLEAPLEGEPQRASVPAAIELPPQQAAQQPALRQPQQPMLQLKVPQVMAKQQEEDHRAYTASKEEVGLGRNGIHFSNDDDNDDDNA